jgi:hypothetical protein
VKIVNVNVIAVEDITMIKLKTLLVEQEQENKYPEDAPKHFGGGENIDIFGFQTKHFDICRSAVTLYEKLKENDDEKVKELIIKSAKDMDHLFEMEKQVVAQEPLDHDPIDHAVELCNTISFKLGRIAEMTGHGDEEEDTHFIQMHVGVIIDRAQKQEMTNENLRKWFQKGGAGGTTAGGWDRYSSTGKKLGKCGGGKKGEAYAACLSAEKAARLGKKGIAAFVNRKRAAQRKAGDAKKGGERKKGQKTTKVKTGA